MCFRSQSIAFLGLLMATTLMSEAVTADGPRVRFLQNRTVESTNRTSTQSERSTLRMRNNVSTSQSQSATNGVNRLPAGRNYYQGRYYGNFNNRFYGPQYGYF